MTSLEKQALYSVLLRLTDDNQILTPMERRDIINQIVHAACGMTADDILSSTQNNRKLQIKRGTKSQNDNYTGLPGEITFDSETQTIRIHNGTLQGGFALAKLTDIPDIIAPDDDYVTTQQVSNLVMPNFESSVSLTFNNSLDYAAPCNGFMLIKGNGISADLYRPNGGTAVMLEYWLSSNYSCNVHPLPQGYRCKYRGGPSEYSMAVFYPCKNIN